MSLITQITHQVPTLVRICEQKSYITQNRPHLMSYLHFIIDVGTYNQHKKLELCESSTLITSSYLISPTRSCSGTRAAPNTFYISLVISIIHYLLQALHNKREDHDTLWLLLMMQLLRSRNI